MLNIDAKWTSILTRKEQREGLLTQIRRKEETAKESLKDKVKESETAVAFDKRCLENDRQEHMKKANYLTQFRDGNKQVGNQNMNLNFFKSIVCFTWIIAG